MIMKLIHATPPPPPPPLPSLDAHPPEHVSMKNVHDIPQQEILDNLLATVTLINYGAINKLSNFYNAIECD